MNYSGAFGTLQSTRQITCEYRNNLPLPRALIRASHA